MILHLCSTLDSCKCEEGGCEFAEERPLLSAFGSHRKHFHVNVSSDFCTDNSKVRKVLGGTFQCVSRLQNARPVAVQFLNPQVYCPDGLSAPLQVPPGFEASGCEGGSERCTRKSPCPKGTSCQKGLQTECAKGYFAERVGSTVCLPAPGFYSDVVRATSCDGCPKAGKHRTRPLLHAAPARRPIRITTASPNCLVQ